MCSDRSVLGFPDMIQGLSSQAADFGIILLPAYVVVGALNGLYGSQQATAMFFNVDIGVVIQVLAVVDRGFLDFPDSRFDLRDRGVLAGIYF
jgi:hypothetical protein